MYRLISQDSGNKMPLRERKSFVQCVARFFSCASKPFVAFDAYLTDAECENAVIDRMAAEARIAAEIFSTIPAATLASLRLADNQPERNKATTAAKQVDRQILSSQ